MGAHTQGVRCHWRSVLTQRYDKKSKTMWLYRKYSADTLVPESEVNQWSKALRDGKAPTGEALSAVNYIFNSQDNAEYNHHMLAFAKLGTYVGTLDANRPVDGDAPSFATKDDFGI